VTRLCIIVAALALIARARVAVLPGWVVPLPVLLTVALFMLCATVVARTALYTPRVWRTPAAPEPAGEGARS
jgi:hypothetical protein